MFKLHRDEKVILYIRRHWIFLAIDASVIFTLFIFPVLFIWMAQYFSWVPDIFLLGVSIYSVTDIIVYIWALFCWMLLAEKFTDYALDFWVVTNKRIIESEKIKLFDVQLSTLELQDIEDITVRSEGFLANIIGYGRLNIQTAGAINEFFAEKIMNPAKVQSVIFSAKLEQIKQEQDIERQEFEQISQRVFKEEMNANIDSYTPIVTNESKVQQFDWAVNEEDRKAVENETGVIEDKYKKGLSQALKSGE